MAKAVWHTATYRLHSGEVEGIYFLSSAESRKALVRAACISLERKFVGCGGGFYRLLSVDGNAI